MDDIHLMACISILIYFIVGHIISVLSFDGLPESFGKEGADYALVTMLWPIVIIIGVVNVALSRKR